MCILGFYCLQNWRDFNHKQQQQEEQQEET